jgi:DNA-binding response OmpR family regulator
VERAATVLVVEDEPPIVRLLAEYLTRESYHVDVAADGEQALQQALCGRPALVILDLMLPGLDGFEVLRRLRAASDVPVLVVTARTEEIDRLLGLGLGADDYVTKPFSPREVVARVQAILRRSRGGGHSAFRVGPLTFDPGGRRVWRDGAELELTALEFDLLGELARHPGMVLTRGQLIDAVWGSGYVGDERIVDVHIARLRRKLERQGPRCALITTVRGVGYRLEARG